MHASSLENMQKCFERFISPEWTEGRTSIEVLDIGGADVNGSYADIFSGAEFNLTAVDLEPGPGVQVVLDDPYQFPFDEDSIDVVISGQAFEHAEFFWELFREMCRVVRRDGFVFLIAPSAGPIHRYPVDCYRFYPDAYVALAKFAGIELLDCWLDERGPWRDLVGVFSKADFDRPSPDQIRHRIAASLGRNRYTQDKIPAPVAVEAQDADVETYRGELSYLEVLQGIHEALKPRFYLEVGVRNGDSLSLATCPAIGVDPDPGKGALAIEGVQVYRETSDFFFEFSCESAIAGQPIDLAFVDGMHLFEFALRDFMNIESLAHSSSVLVIDDVFPNHHLQASRSRRSQVWTGDVWKLYHSLREHRPDLELIPLDASPTGVLIVANLDPRNRVLWDQYNPLVRSYRDMGLEECEALILEREEALPPQSDELSTRLQGLRERRAE